MTTGMPRVERISLATSCSRSCNDVLMAQFLDSGGYEILVIARARMQRRYDFVSVYIRAGCLGSNVTLSLTHDYASSMAVEKREDETSI